MNVRHNNYFHPLWRENELFSIHRSWNWQFDNSNDDWRICRHWYYLEDLLVQDKRKIEEKELKFLILLAVFAMVAITPAYALERSDIDDFKKQTAQKEKDVAALDTKISEQKITIQNRETLADQKREELRDAKDSMGQSWDALLSVERIEKQYENSLKSVKEAKDYLVTLLNEKSKLVLALKMSDSDLIKMENELKNQKNPKFDISKITKLIGIQLSNSCINLIKNNLPNDCPTYETLQQLDTSLETSGKFEFKDGYYHRTTPQYVNSWRLYDHDPTPRVIVDPPQGMTERIKMITINPNFSVYFTASDQKLDNSVRTWHEGRYIDNCKQAYISSTDWHKILPDTIATLHNNCTHTSLEELKTEKMPFTDLPLGETRWYKDKVWLEESIKKCKGLCFEY